MNKNEDLIKLGESIRLERIKQKLSQEDLANRAKIPQYQHLGKIERAEVDMKVTRLFSILRALNCKLEDLIDLDNIVSK